MDIKYSKADYESMTAFLNFFFDYTFVPLPWIIEVKLSYMWIDRNSKD